MNESVEFENYGLFIQYLKNQNLNSAEKYAKGLWRWSNDLVKSNILSKSVFSIVNVDEFEHVEAKIKSSSIYINHR